ncbi:hypothetical protein TYRP_006396 [Tyrophagus putrescentiae]|nr:hypothetical protein TYRP_006396 [Tyrophagus putrescentiae]
MRSMNKEGSKNQLLKKASALVANRSFGLVTLLTLGFIAATIALIWALQRLDWDDRYLLNRHFTETVTTMERTFARFTTRINRHPQTFGNEMLFPHFYRQLADCTTTTTTEEDSEEEEEEEQQHLTEACGELLTFLQDLDLLPSKYHRNYRARNDPFEVQWRQLNAHWMAYYHAHPQGQQLRIMEDHPVEVPQTLLPLLNDPLHLREHLVMLPNGGGATISYRNLKDEFMRNQAVYETKNVGQSPDEAARHFLLMVGEDFEVPGAEDDDGAQQVERQQKRQQQPHLDDRPLSPPPPPLDDADEPDLLAFLDTFDFSDLPIEDDGQNDAEEQQQQPPEPPLFENAVVEEEQQQQQHSYQDQPHPLLPPPPPSDDDDAEHTFKNDDHQLAPPVPAAPLPAGPNHNAQPLKWDDGYLYNRQFSPETVASVQDPFARLSEKMNAHPQAYVNAMLFPHFYRQLADCTTGGEDGEEQQKQDCTDLLVFLQDLGLLPQWYHQNSRAIGPNDRWLKLERDWLAFYHAHPEGQQAMVEDHPVEVSPDRLPLLNDPLHLEEHLQMLPDDGATVSYSSLMEEFMRYKKVYATKTSLEKKRNAFFDRSAKSRNRLLKLRAIFLLAVGEDFVVPEGAENADEEHQVEPQQQQQQPDDDDEPDLLRILNSYDLADLPSEDDDDYAELFGDDHQLKPTPPDSILNPQQMPWDDEYLRGRPIPETLAAVVGPFALLSKKMNTYPQAYVNAMLFPTFFRQLADCTTGEDGEEEEEQQHLTETCGDLLTFLEDLDLLPERYHRNFRAFRSPFEVQWQNLNEHWLAYYRAHLQEHLQMEEDHPVQVPPVLVPLLNDPLHLRDHLVRLPHGGGARTVSSRHLMDEFMRYQAVYATKTQNNRQWIAFYRNNVQNFKRLLKLRAIFLLMAGEDFEVPEGAENDDSEQVEQPLQWEDNYLRGPRKLTPETVAAVEGPFALLSKKMNAYPLAYVNAMIFPPFFLQLEDCSTRKNTEEEEVEFCSELLTFLQNLGLLPRKYHRKLRTRSPDEAWSELEWDWLGFHATTPTEVEDHPVEVPLALVPLLNDPKHLNLNYLPDGGGSATVSYSSLIKEFLRYQAVYTTKISQKRKKVDFYDNKRARPRNRLLKLRAIFLLAVGKDFEVPEGAENESAQQIEPLPPEEDEVVEEEEQEPQDEQPPLPPPPADDDEPDLLGFLDTIDFSNWPIEDDGQNDADDDHQLMPVPAALIVPAEVNLYETSPFVPDIEEDVSGGQKRPFEEEDDDPENWYKKVFKPEELGMRSMSKEGKKSHFFKMTSFLLANRGLVASLLTLGFIGAFIAIIWTLYSVYGSNSSQQKDEEEETTSATTLDDIEDAAAKT